MGNVISNVERNNIINWYSFRLDGSNGGLRKYYDEIVNNMTYEDAKKLLEYGAKYGFIVQDDSLRAAFKVILAYVGEYYKSFNVFIFRKAISDFADYYEFLCAQVEYYGNLIKELSDRDSISSIMAKSICQCVAEKYPELANMPLLGNLNNYLVSDTNELLKCKYRFKYNNLSYTKKKTISRRCAQWLSYGNDQRNPNFVGDNC